MSELFDKYDELIIKIINLENNESNISNIGLELAKQLKKDWQRIYDELIDIHFEVSKSIYVDKIDEDSNIVFKDTLILTPKQVLVFSEKRANVIQFKYLYPLNIRLNEFAEKKAKKRDYLLFGLSVFISTVLGFIVSYYFDKDNDSDLDVYFKQSIKNQKKIIQNQDKVLFSIDSLQKLDTINTDANQTTVKN